VSRTAVGCASLLLVACVRGATIDGAAAAPPSPARPWTPSARVIAAAAHDTIPVRTDAPVVRQLSRTTLTLGDIVDIALQNNPATRLSWAQAQAAADAYGSAQGRYYPTLDASVALGRQRSLAAPGRVAGERTQYGPALSLSYLVLDFGGRSGTIDVARQTAIAADLAHNAAIENTILQVEGAAFTYFSTRAQRDAQQAAVDGATAVLDAANERHRVGLATIADVLQARTARSQTQLAFETLEGSLQVTRGGLAVAMGFPANTPVELPDLPGGDSVHFIAASVDSLIDMAVRNRPELAAARAQVAVSASQIRVARSASLPAFAVSATGTSNNSDVATFTGRTYTLNLGVQIPVFSGSSRSYDVRAANDLLQAATARAEVTRRQIILQVFTSYYSLRTATNRVHTSADLLASATESEAVARGRYREGVGSIVDLLIAQSALATARAQEADARWQWRTALAQLAHDVGTLRLDGEAAFAPDMTDSRIGK
jgi:outer membrane protein